jgi:uncharacterized membrane protein SpoIIM required for sporulation
MKLLDRSPGAVLVLAFLVIGAMTGVIALMWQADSVLGVAAALVLVLAGAVWIGSLVGHVLDDEGEPAPEEAAARTPPTVAVHRPAALR